jgi:hypothetical protein
MGFGAQVAQPLRALPEARHDKVAVARGTLDDLEHGAPHQAGPPTAMLEEEEPVVEENPLMRPV